jgi:AraC-like DNA-binding protein
LVILRSLSDDLLTGATSTGLETLCRRESCIVVARARHAESVLAPRPFALVAARGGRELYSLERRQIAVDDDNVLVLGEGRSYGTHIRSETEVECFKIFFRTGMADEVLAPLLMPEDRLLERDASCGRTAFEFCEGLQPRERRLSLVLNYIRHHALAGNDDAAWFEEQLGLLLERLLLGHREIVRRVQAIPCARAGTRKEIHRRISLAVDYIESCYDQPIDLETLAQVACLSKFHFLRAFRYLQGVTPQHYLQRKRAIVAKRLLATTALSAAEIALQVGYASRTSLTKQVRQWTGSAPAEIRRGLALEADAAAVHTGVVNSATA